MSRGGSLLLVLALVPGCKRKPEAQPLAQDDGKGKTHACKLVAGGHIEKDTLVEAGCDVWVSEPIRIEKGATLRIEAGARLAFTKAASLTVVDGVLVAAGEAAKPITFTSAETTQAAGDWGGLALLSKKPGTSLTHAIVEYGTVDVAAATGGPKSTRGPIRRPGIYVGLDAAPVAFADLRVRHTPQVGLFAEADAAFARFERVHVEDVGGIALDVRASALAAVTSLTSADPVRVWGSLEKSASWPKVTLLVGELSVQGTATEPAVLTLAPETVVRVGPGGELRFGSGEKAGALVARKVIFTSAVAAPVPGEWVGLRFDRHAPGTRIEDCVIEFAGWEPPAPKPSIAPSSKTPPVKPVALAVEEEMKDFVVRKNTFRNNAGPAIGRTSRASAGGCVGLDVKDHGNTSIGQPLCQPKSAIFAELEKLEVLMLGSLSSGGTSAVLKAGGPDPSLDVLGSKAGVGGPGGAAPGGGGAAGGGTLAPAGGTAKEKP